MKTQNWTYGKLRWFLLGIALIGIAGCGRVNRFSLQSKPALTVESVTASLPKDAQPVETLWLRAQVFAQRTGLPGKRHFEATILFVSPDRLRLRAYRNVSLLVFDLLADGKGIQLWNPADKNLYAASHERLSRTQSEWAGLDPSLVSKGLLVEQMLSEELKQAQSAVARRRWKTNELRLATMDASIRVHFDRKTGRITALNYKPRDGRFAVKIRYGEMIEVEGVRLPQWVEIDHKATRTCLRLEISEYKINRKFQNAVFSPQWPIRGNALPLELLK